MTIASYWKKIQDTVELQWTLMARAVSNSFSSPLENYLAADLG